MAGMTCAWVRIMLQLTGLLLLMQVFCMVAARWGYHWHFAYVLEVQAPRC